MGGDSSLADGAAHMRVIHSELRPAIQRILLLMNSMRFEPMPSELFHAHLC